MDTVLDRLVQGVLTGELSREAAAETIAQSHVSEASADSLLRRAHRQALDLRHSSPRDARLLLELCQLVGTLIPLDAEEASSIAGNLGGLLFSLREPAAALPHLERSLE